MEALTPRIYGGRGPYLEYRALSRPLFGQDLSGDASVVADFEAGVVVCVIDGLGHGDEAAKAAAVARSVILANAGEPLLDLARLCHEELKKTRGAVTSFASFDAYRDSMSWLGVGNVEAVLFRHDSSGAVARESLVPRGGVLGYTLPPLHCADLAVRPGDLLVMATDGVAGAFAESIDPNADLEKLAGDLMEKYGKLSDDALILTARYLGGKAE